MNSISLYFYQCLQCGETFKIHQESTKYLESSCLVEIGGANTLADNIPLISTRHQLHFLLIHNLLQLLPHLSHLNNKLQVRSYHLNNKLQLSPEQQITGSQLSPEQQITGSQLSLEQQKYRFTFVTRTTNYRFTVIT